MSVTVTNKNSEKGEVVEGSHSIVMEERQKLFVSGVRDVLDFSECNVMLDTVCGVLVIEGEGMKLTALDVESGDLTMTGRVSDLFYSEKRGKAKNGLIGKKNKMADSGKSKRYITGGAAKG